jgi:hypothetical protein
MGSPVMPKVVDKINPGVKKDEKNSDIAPLSSKAGT